MGASPPKNWVQRVTIEIPGPVKSQAKWKEFKDSVEELLKKYENTIKPKIRGIANERVKGKGGPNPGEIVVRPTKKKKKTRRP